MMNKQNFSVNGFPSNNEICRSLFMKQENTSYEETLGYKIGTAVNNRLNQNYNVVKSKRRHWFHALWRSSDRLFYLMVIKVCLTIATGRETQSYSKTNASFLTSSHCRNALLYSIEHFWQATIKSELYILLRTSVLVRSAVLSIKSWCFAS